MNKKFLTILLSVLLVVAPIALNFNVAHATNSVTFIGTDTTTQGNWVGTYGTDGYWIEHNFNPTDTSIRSLPAYVTSIGWDGSTAGYDWTGSDQSDVRLLTLPDGVTTTRLATTFYDSTFKISLTLTSAKIVRFYFMDYDGGNSRSETVNAIDRDTSSVLDTRSMSSFSNGKYLSYTVSGNIDFQFVYIGGANSVVQAVFFDPGSSPPPNLTTATLRVGGTLYIRGSLIIK